MRTKIVSSLYTLIGLPLTAPVASLLLRGFPLGDNLYTMESYEELFKELNWQLEDLITVCKPCHKKLHKHE